MFANAYKGGVLNQRFFEACQRGEASTAENILIDASQNPNLGFDINHVRTDKTPLLEAAFGKHWGVCALLLEFYAEIQHSNKFGLTAFHLMAKHAPVYTNHEGKEIDLLQLLKKLQSPSDDPDIDPYPHFYVDVVDKLGNTPLYYCVENFSEHKNFNAIKLLIDWGADLNVQNNAGKTLLHLAVDQNNPTLTQFLKDLGATSNKLFNEQTPAQMAQTLQYHEVMTVLADTLTHTSNTPSTITKEVVKQQSEAPEEAASVKRRSLNKF